MEKFRFAGIEIDNLSLEETLDRIDFLLSNNRLVKQYIFTPNAWHILELQKNKTLQEAYKNAYLLLSDGFSIILASHFLGAPLKERITGIDLFEELLKLAEHKGYKIYLLGATENVIKQTVSQILKKYNGIKIVGYHHGYFSDDNTIVKQINLLSPDILFVGMGFPKQELWIYRNINLLNVKVVVCVGGTFDVISGKFKRAPKWMQKIGLEWLWRLIQEPRRLWKRYLIGNTIFVWLVLKEMFKRLLKKYD